MTVERLKPHEISCQLGKDYSSAAVTSLVFNVFDHPNWNNEKDSNDADVTVIVLMDSITFNEAIQPVCLPAQNFVYGSEIGTVIGWSRNDQRGQNPTQVKANVVDSSVCYKTSERQSAESTNRTFCGEFDDENQTQCLKTSGGGLYIKNHRSWSIRGISSGQNGFEGSCTSDKAQIFTSIVAYIDWIQEVMEKTKETLWKDVSFDCSIERERNERQVKSTSFVECFTTV